jgi:ATP-dependent Clp protease ATP-binding subunit ClpA
MLDKKTIADITKIHLAGFQHKVQGLGITLNIPDSVIDFIADKGFVEEFGARPMKRAIKQYLIVPISQYILQHPEVKTISTDIKADKLIIV